MSSKFFRFGAATAVILLALAYLAYTGVQEGRSYYSTIQQLHKMDDSVYAKRLRVSGYVQPGSIHQVGTNADFVMEENGETLKVSYKGSEPPPDTFKDNAQALAMGRMGRDGVFHANELQAKCASKYAAQPGAGGQPATASQPSSLKN
jgi:cytochrome c-type biogenesis protein CcmE